jgi:exopolysaccharide biosynthesis polyprenyl glycosylphosphotransferase
MNNSGWQKHWQRVARHFSIDVALFAAAFLSGMVFRFGADWQAKIWDYLPSVLFASLSFSCVTYIFGLYAPQSGSQSLFKRALLLAGCLLISIVLLSTTFYFNYSGRIGRGVMLFTAPLAYFAILLHHLVLWNRFKNYRERVALIVTCHFDELEIQLNPSLWQQHLELVGVVQDDHYEPGGSAPTLGRTRDLPGIVERHGIDRILCTEKSFSDPALYKQFCALRYSGTNVMPLIGLCEEVHGNVPLELITPEWLLNASALPHMLYIRKLKRGFDIISSLVGLVVLGPFLLLGIAATKLASPGPVFYRQVRAGRFGRAFSMLKLRTMRVDAEKDGAVWARAKDDRVTPVGHVLRKYRIDEIPQLINVLRGDMSLVGPRPERPEFVEELAREIPYFQERLMVQPGITGWAQVRYPYGASIADASRKLEYDLYYMKNMSVFLDIFILLDTVRVVLMGGLREEHKQAAPRYESSQRATSINLAAMPASQTSGRQAMH